MTSSMASPISFVSSESYAYETGSTDARPNGSTRKGSEILNIETDKVLSTLESSKIFTHYTIKEPHFAMRQHNGCHTFSGINEDTKAKVTVRLERLEKNSRIRLHTEAHILKALGGTKNIFQTLYTSGELDIADEKYFAIVLEGMGPNLYQLQSIYRLFDYHTNIMLAHQMLVCLLRLHSLGYIHGNLSLLNFGFGVAHKFVVLMLVDYTRCSRYVASENGTAEPHSHKVPYPLYSSCDAMRGVEPMSPRDDLISMCYMMMHLYLGRLPWMHLRKEYLDHREYLAKTLESKENYQVSYGQLPPPYGVLWKAIQAMRMPDGFDDFKSKHDQIFLNHLKDMGKSIDYKYEWVMKDLPNI